MAQTFCFQLKVIANDQSPVVILKVGSYVDGSQLLSINSNVVILE